MKFSSFLLLFHGMTHTVDSMDNKEWLVTYYVLLFTAIKIAILRF